jgi:integrase
VPARRAGQPTQILLHMDLDRLRGLPGAAAAEAAWAGAAAGPGDDCDATIVPVVTHVQGLTSGPLWQAVPKVAGRRPGLPRPLEPEGVRALLGSCDTGAAAGLRDLAMLTLMTRLGLRAGEVAGLQLGDISWRDGRRRSLRSSALTDETEPGGAVKKSGISRSRQSVSWSDGTVGSLIAAGRARPEAFE